MLTKENLIAGSRSLLGLGLGVFAGCATIVSGSSQKISFTSTPPGATVTIKAKATTLEQGIATHVTGEETSPLRVKTPGELEISTGTAQVAEYTWPDGKTVVVPIRRSLNLWTIWGGPAGWVIDVVTGAVWDLDPSKSITADSAMPAEIESQQGQ